MRQESCIVFPPCRAPHAPALSLVRSPLRPSDPTGPPVVPPALVGSFLHSPSPVLRPASPHFSLSISLFPSSCPSPPCTLSSSVPSVFSSLASSPPFFPLSSHPPAHLRPSLLLSPFLPSFHLGRVLSSSTARSTDTKTEALPPLLMTP